MSRTRRRKSDLFLKLEHRAIETIYDAVMSCDDEYADREWGDIIERINVLAINIRERDTDRKTEESRWQAKKN